MKSRWRVALLVPFFAFGTARGEETSRAGFSVEEAIEVAWQENAGAQAARDAAEAAHHGVRESVAAFLPEAGGNLSYFKNDGDVFFLSFVNPPMPGQLNPDAPSGGTPIGDEDTTQEAGFFVRQSIYAGGANLAQYHASTIEADLALLDAEDQRVALAQDVKSAYFGRVFGDRRLEVAREATDRSVQSLGAVEQRFEEREALEADVLGARARLASDRHALALAENEQALAAYQLNRLLGRGLDEALTLTDPLEARTEPPSVEQAVAHALESNLEIRRAKLRQELADQAIAGAWSNFHPKLGADFQFSYLDNELFYKGTLYGVTLNVTIPFARDLVAGSGALGKARANRRAADNAFRELVRGTELRVRQAALRAREAHGSIAVAEANLAFRRERQKVSTTAFKEELATFSDVLEDNTSLSEAELGLAQALYAHRLRRAELDRLLGVP